MSENYLWPTSLFTQSVNQYHSCLEVVHKEKTADSCCEATLSRSDPSISMRFSLSSSRITSSCCEMRLILRFSHTATPTNTTRLLKNSQNDTPYTQLSSWMRFMAKQLRLSPMPQVSTIRTDLKLFLQFTAAALYRNRLFVVISLTAYLMTRNRSQLLRRKAKRKIPKQSFPMKSSQQRMAWQKVSLGGQRRVCMRVYDTQPSSSEKAQSRLVHISMVLGLLLGVGEVGAKEMRIHWQQAMEKTAQTKVKMLRREAMSSLFLSTRCLWRFQRWSSSSEESEDSILQTNPIPIQQISSTSRVNFILSHHFIAMRNMLPVIFLALAAISLLLYFLNPFKPKPPAPAAVKTQAPPPQKQSHGRLRIYFGSQTGTAAKLAEQLGDEAGEQGFQAEVIDLKDITIEHLETINELSVFLLSNTGEGDPPENCVRWMKVLRGRESLHEERDVRWKKVNFTIFGLGNTQYEHYNKTAIDCDSLLEKLGGNRVYKLGLGDDNCSLEDDFTEWRKELWSTLKQFRRENPLVEAQDSHASRKISECSDQNVRYLSKGEPHFANYKLFFKRGSEEDYEWKEEDLDFKTKASLKAEVASLKGTRQLRQNETDGSTLELEVELPQQPAYQTAGNIALYSRNDPIIVALVQNIFKISQEDMDKPLGLTRLNPDKKLKLNFIPKTVRSLLEESIDLQGKISKSLLKKLSKLQSSNPNYFSENSLKTTEEFQRLTERTDQGEWHHLARLVQDHKVNISFQDFVELSDSMAPRLFTIASHAQTQPNVIVAASLVPNGLISKYFLTNPAIFRAELRKSTFTDAMRWKKVIFVAAGTGLAPFRAYLQEKAYNIAQKEAGKEVNVPIVTLFFGCKHADGDFIYRDQIRQWQSSGVINRLHLAFSRDSAQKVYVQDLLKREEAEVKELGFCEETALYICGSLPMGHSIIQVLTEALGAEKVKQMEEKGRIVKELW